MNIIFYPFAIDLLNQNILGFDVSMEVLLRVYVFETLDDLCEYLGGIAQAEDFVGLFGLKIEEISIFTII